MENVNAAPVIKEALTKILVINTPSELAQIKKGSWVTVLLMPEKHILEFPKDGYLHSKAVKVLNKVFMVEERQTGRISVLSFGTKIKVKTEDLIKNENE